MSQLAKDIFILEVDIQTIYNKFSYDRTLDLPAKENLKRRLIRSKQELKTLTKNAQTHTSTTHIEASGD